MAATFGVIEKRVGEGGREHGASVRLIQQLLARALMVSTEPISGVWSRTTTDSLLTFQQSIGVPESERTRFIEPRDPHKLLETLCRRAGVLLPLPPKHGGVGTFLEFFKTASQQNVPYAWGQAGGADRLIFGYQHSPQWLIFTNARREFDLMGSAIAMNCISFTNLALSICRTGGAHAHPYDCRQNDGGFTSVGSRFGLPYLKRNALPASASSTTHATVSLPANFASTADTYFYSASEVSSVTKPDALYYVQWCYLKEHHRRRDGKTFASGFGHHDTVLYNGDIYETNLGGRKALRITPIAQRMQGTSDAVRLMGPV